MRYSYRCDEHGVDVREFPINSEKGEQRCAECDGVMVRVFESPPIHYHSQGFHRTDYDKYGDKLTQFNDHWSKVTGEKPPPADSTVPRNSSEPF